VKDPAFGDLMEMGRDVRATLRAEAPPPTLLDALAVRGFRPSLLNFLGSPGIQDRCSFGVVDMQLERAVESLQASMEEEEEEPLTKEEEEDDSVPAHDPEPPRARAKRLPPPSYVEMRRQLCNKDPTDDNFVPFSLRQLCFREGKFGPHELRALWAAQFAPSLHELLTVYRVVPPDIADILLAMTSNGQDLLGAGIFLNVDHASLPQHLRRRIEALHSAYGLPYLAKVRDLIISLSGLGSDGVGEARREVWLDMREVLLVEWLGVLRGRSLALSDEKGTKPYSVELETIPGTFIIRWIKVRRWRRWSLISALKKLLR
jgi:hypothetical protein